MCVRSENHESVFSKPQNMEMITCGFVSYSNLLILTDLLIAINKEAASRDGMSCDLLSCNINL